MSRNHLTPPVMDAIQKHIEHLDEVSSRYERRWGIGRLPLLVPVEWRTKFENQMQRVNDLMEAGDLPALEQAVDAMKRGWAKLEALALEGGAEPVAPTVWEFVTPQGQHVAICRTMADAHVVARHHVQDGATLAVYSLDEIGRLLDAFPTLVKAKELWTECRVVSATVRPKTNVPLLDDDLSVLEAG